jgi:WD40 repeat protein
MGFENCQFSHEVHRSSVLSLICKGHQNIVNSVIVNEEFIFSGSLDSSAKQWDKTSGSLIQTFSIASSAKPQISSLAYWKEYLFTATNYPNNFLLQWRLSDGSIYKKYEGSISQYIDVC